MLIRFRARSLPMPIGPSGSSAFYGLFAVDAESNVPIYIAEHADGAPVPDAQACFCGKTIPARDDDSGATQNQGQDTSNGRDLRTIYGCTDPYYAPTPTTVLAAGDTLVFNADITYRARTDAAFTVPAVSATATLTLDAADLAASNLAVDDEFSIGDGMYKVVSLDSSTDVTVRNLGEACAMLTPFG